jgi:translation initiation factor IF-2
MVRIELREWPLYEVANAYGMNSIELLTLARDELHLNVKSHMSVLTQGDYEVLVQYLEQKQKKVPLSAPSKGSEKANGKELPTGKEKASGKEPDGQAPAKAKITVRRKSPEAKTQDGSPKIEPSSAPSPPRDWASVSEEEAGPKLTGKTIVRKAAPKPKPGLKPLADKKSREPMDTTEVGLEAGAAAVPAAPEAGPRPAGRPREAVVISRPDPEIQKRAEKEKRQREEPKTSPEAPGGGAESKVGRKETPKEEGLESREPDRKPAALIQKTEVFRPVDYIKREQAFRSKRKRVRASVTSMTSTPITTPAAHKRVIAFSQPVSVKDLAKKMSIKATDLLRKLKSLGVEAPEETLLLDFETCALVAPEFHFEVTDDRFTEEKYFKSLDAAVQDPGLQPRAPVVTVMGHVDHGKTTILDVIRKTQVTAREAGGITQHIGAYKVLHQNKPITFIDTPGHAAFTAMRKRGASLTDIIVLVVAADDGVMPQTKEAISHAKAAGVSMIVAVNKMDAPGANLDKVRNQLSEVNVLSEEWGGDTLFVPVSAIKGQGIEDLLNAILLVAEMNEVKGAFLLHPSAVVIESKLDKNKGPLATVIVTQGVFRSGGYVVAGTVSGKIRQMLDENLNPVKEAKPGDPVEIIGFDQVVEAGVRVDVLPSEKDIRALVDYRRERLDQLKQESAQASVLSIEALMDKVGETETRQKQVNVILKADVKGSEEALKTSLEALTTDEHKVHIVFSGSGGVTESDIDLAKTTQSILVLFGIALPSGVRKTLEQREIKFMESRIIYELIDQFQRMLKADREPVFEREELGEIEVRQIFKLSKAGMVAGSYVKSGRLIRNAMVEIFRGGNHVGTAKITSLKRFKDDVREVKSGFECGLSTDWSEGELAEGDMLKAYRMVEKPVL